MPCSQQVAADTGSDMIKYALVCAADHEFEGWFSGSDAFDDQKARGLVECPICGITDVSKQIMAPSVRTSGEKSGRMPSKPNSDSTPTPEDFARMAGKVREHIASTHDYVGDRFADEARSMFYGEQEHRPVWGETTAEEAKSLVEEGVPAAPLPTPFAPKPPVKPKDVN